MTRREREFLQKHVANWMALLLNELGTDVVHSYIAQWAHMVTDLKSGLCVLEMDEFLPTKEQIEEANSTLLESMKQFGFVPYRRDIVMWKNGHTLISWVYRRKPIHHWTMN